MKSRKGRKCGVKRERKIWVEEDGKEKNETKKMENENDQDRREGKYISREP